MLISIIGGILGAVITFLLQKCGLNIVIASCIVGLIGALFSEYFRLPHLGLVIFAGSFVGMSTFSLKAIPLVIFGGALSGLLYKLSLNMFVGFGGRLGAIAFASTVISFYLFSILKKFIFAKIKVLKL